MKAILALIGFFISGLVLGQTTDTHHSSFSIRLTILMVPVTPLLTMEIKATEKTTIQFESNFVNIHGVNLKYFLNSGMKYDYVFKGLAILKSSDLREDYRVTYLPYVGYGCAYRFGVDNRWDLESRIGIGITANADKNILFPVIKSGLGYVFKP
jgi:hypothetical protein